MSDNEIKEILIQRKREARRIEEMKRREERREDIWELAGDALAWICWAGLGYMMFLGAYMVG